MENKKIHLMRNLLYNVIPYEIPHLSETDMIEEMMEKIEKERGKNWIQKTETWLLHETCYKIHRLQDKWNSVILSNWFWKDCFWENANEVDVIFKHC